MPTQARVVRDAVFVDNVDLKRVARSYLKCAANTPPRDLDDALQMVAQWMGYPNLHAVHAQASRADGGVGFEASDSVGGPYRLHPFVMGTQSPTGRAQPQLGSVAVQDVIAASGLMDGLSGALSFLSSECGVHVDAQLERKFLQLRELEQLAHFILDISSSAAQGCHATLMRHFQELPGYMYRLDQPFEVLAAHRAISGLIEVASDGWQLNPLGESWDVAFGRYCAKLRAEREEQNRLISLPRA